MIIFSFLNFEKFFLKVSATVHCDVANEENYSPDAEQTDFLAQCKLIYCTDWFMWAYNRCNLLIFPKPSCSRGEHRFHFLQIKGFPIDLHPKRCVRDAVKVNRQIMLMCILLALSIIPTLFHGTKISCPCR
jgi:hypothetical protein